MTPDTPHSGPPPAQGAARSRASARIAAAAAGFALSAGWYWFPRVHPLWTKTSPYLVSPYDAKGLAFVLALFIGVKAVVLFVFGPPLERACASAGGGDGASLRQRLMSSLPFFAVQMIAWLFLLPLLYPPDQPATPALLAPVLLGASDILFSLIWLSVLIRLPGDACCFAYAIGALGGLGLHWLPLSPAHAHLLRSMAPLLAGPLLFLAAPPAGCGTRACPGETPRDPGRAAIAPGAPPAYVVFGFFAVTASLRALIDFNGNGFPFSQALVHAASPEPAGLDTLALLGHASGGFLAAFAIRRGWCLRLPVLTLAFLGSCAVLLPLCGLARPASASVFPLHLAAGTGAAFAIFLLGRFVRMGRPLVLTSCQALFALTVGVCLSGLSLWFIALRIHSNALPPHEIYLQLLGLAVLLLIPLCYALRLPLRRVLESRHLRSPSSSAKAPSLTRRELEVARLVQSGMKNLEISARLNIAETTLRVHLRSIYKKLGIRGRDNLAAVDLSELAEERNERPMRKAVKPAAFGDPGEERPHKMCLP